MDELHLKDICILGDKAYEAKCNGFQLLKLTDYAFVV